MNLIFPRLYIEFLLFFILLIANSSTGSFQGESTRDPSAFEFCRTKSCGANNTTTVCRNRGRNETTSGRCCVKNGNVVGLDLSNCSLTTLPSLESLKVALRWLYLQDNPALECNNKTFVNSFKGLINLSEVVLPSRCNCTGGNSLWTNHSTTGSERWCEGQKNSCSFINVTCPANSACSPNGPGFTQCLCEPGWFGYKCLVKVLRSCFISVVYCFVLQPSV
ncbi:all-trans retinoic acid-induced differentiation factor-like isoform X2 [Orbicella faveolata]|uniref:all-trans retinoic acid-induced differentiation factor-like isoform X2 n=1 Tax=Orbicella faveolata TaxID=48498 RepID=UPI0009E2889C|nr:all-trans retinoic acid-induced differentiation factor-like isoform X2 [Orbicella faveolata]